MSSHSWHIRWLSLPYPARNPLLIALTGLVITTKKQWHKVSQEANFTEGICIGVFLQVGQDLHPCLRVHAGKDGIAYFLCKSCFFVPWCLGGEQSEVGVQDNPSAAWVSSNFIIKS